MREGEDYIVDAIRRFGDNANPKISEGFAEIHDRLISSPSVYDLKIDQTFKGEVFYPPFGTTVENGIQYVGTAYDVPGMLFVVHTQMSSHYPKYRQKMNDFIEWDNDIVGTTYITEESDLLSHRVFDTYKPKWGKEVEGYVLHPHDKSVPPLKIIDPRWKERKQRIQLFS